MKHLASRALTLVAAFALVTPAALAQTTLTLSSWAGPTHLLTNEVMLGWAKEVEKASNGRIKHNLLPKPVAAPAGTFDAVRDGLVDVSFVLHGASPGRFVLPKLVEFPQMGASGEINSQVYQRIHDKYLAQAGEHRGVRVLAVFTHGPGHILTSGKRAVAKISDLSGVKLRVGGGAVSELMQALGAAPVVRPGSETHDLLAGGVVDGTLVPYETYTSFRLENLVRNVTRVPGGLYTLSFAVIMNERAFNALAPQDQAVITSLSGERYARMAGKAWDDMDRVGFEAMKKNGVNVIEADAAFISSVRESAAKIEAAWVEEAKKKGVDGAVALREFREETRRLAGTR